MPGTVEVVHNAEIITATGESSRQCDIVIVDKNTPKLRDIKSHRIIPVECVYGVIEVKSRLTSPELIKACENIATVKRLPRNAYVKLRKAPMDTLLVLNTLLRLFSDTRFPSAVFS